MKINISFNTDSAAFEDSYEMEVARILRQIKDDLIDSNNTTNIRSPLRDSNGNRIGTVTISDDSSAD